jgi:ribonucleoside-diphosphate reductase alpha chain
MNIDNANEHGSWSVPVYMSNLCLTGDTKIDAVIDGKKTLISLSELDDIFKIGKEIMVLSKNIYSSIISYEKVSDSALTGENAELMQIEDIDSGFTIRCTPEHKIFTKNRGYVEAKNLEENDELDIIP